MQLMTLSLSRLVVDIDDNLFDDIWYNPRHVPFARQNRPHLHYNSFDLVDILTVYVLRLISLAYRDILP